MSFQRTVIKYALQMEPCTALSEATSGNLVSNAMMLSPRPHHPHQNRLTPGFPDLCHSLPQPLCEHHTQLYLWPRTKPCCPSSYTYVHAKGHPSAYTHIYTKCSTCATTMVGPYPHSTKMPDHRDVGEEVTASGSMNDVFDLEHPWMILAICALRSWTIGLEQEP